MAMPMLETECDPRRLDAVRDAQLLHEGGLAATGLAADEHQPAIAGAGLVPVVLQLRCLGVARNGQCCPSGMSVTLWGWGVTLMERGPVQVDRLAGAAIEPRAWALGVMILRRERLSSSIARTVRSTA